ncbi:hypothetical protein MIN45_P1518 [Methylomarinovum tepidoasis]|uniref:diguanylate cyclase n=1 Tax=Methylomarinovum tepidoasis TaxID=2840183 RepID=A0AAU9CRX8_9GAMM|nr:GGDEF domain-containing protein [Methylomarinovum sp. IN45]BCX89148.1 hypothetical protein MIN45_P1518 [Methylomarinovum sp. IN45]
MNRLSCDIERLLEELEILSDFDVESLVIEHLQKHLNTLDALQRTYQQHYLDIIRLLLQQLTELLPESGSPLHQRLQFFDRLLTRPSLEDLKTLQQGVRELQRMINARATGQPATAARSTSQALVIGDIDDRLAHLERNNARFTLPLQQLLHQLEELEGSRPTGEIRAALEQHIHLLLEGQQQLDRQLAELRQQLAQARLENRQLDEELQRARSLSLTDELTGLPNRRAFLQRLEGELARIQRHPVPLTLAIIDLDHFKQINDRYGHTLGDEVLCTYAEHVFSGFRRQDYVARYGGEEFIVLLPNTDTAGAVKALEKIREAVKGHSLKAESETFPLPSFSAGVVSYREGEAPKDFIERADRALYQAKQAGRDRIEVGE